MQAIDIRLSLCSRAAVQGQAECNEWIPSRSGIANIIEEKRSMSTWRDRRILDLFGIEAPIVLGPMAGPGTPELAIAVCEAGGLGSLPCALLSAEQARDGIALIRSKTRAPINLNFFCRSAASRRSAQHGMARATGGVLRRTRTRSRSHAARGRPSPVRQRLLRARGGTEIRGR